ncbi:MAG: Mut7-C RNAse domain-containing protein [Armatimonadota bacterium]|nr:Mut7-C RNAse domain-containing protein [Armatimonadota bacterium]
MSKLTGEEQPAPRFLADCMLGKLAKWLRLVGYDTVFIHDATDDQLVRVSVRENRILLTKDHSLAERRMVRGRCCFVTEEGTGAQLRQVMRDLDLRIDESMAFSRCPVCNSEIEQALKSTVEEHVPSYVYRTQEQFGRCAGCGRIYWKGTHVEHVLQALHSRKKST